MNQPSLSSAPNSPTSSSPPSGSGVFQQLPTTPKSSGNPRRLGLQQRPRQRKAQSSSPQSLSPFASSSMCSSPSAKNVPLPPAEWLNQLHASDHQFDTPSRPSSSFSMMSNASSSTSSSSGILSSSFPMSSTPSYPFIDLRGPEKNISEAMRIHVSPHQLIAAIAMA